jgi:hypothetical protein
VKELVLNGGQDLGETRDQALRQGHAEAAVELVHGANSRHAQRVLGHTLAAAEAGFAFVAAAGVEAG